MVDADAKEELHHITLTLGERAQRTVDLFGKAFVDQLPVGRHAVVVREHVQQAVALTLHEWSVHADMATAHLHGVGHFLRRKLQ